MMKYSPSNGPPKNNYKISTTNKTYISIASSIKSPKKYIPKKYINLNTKLFTTNNHPSLTLIMLIKTIPIL